MATGDNTSDRADLPPRIARVYPPPGPDGIVVYAGALDVETDHGFRRAHGQLELHLFPETWFGSHFKGTFKDLGPISFLGASEIAVDIPTGASLEPPAATVLPSERQKGSWVDMRDSIPELRAGDLAAAERFVIHYTGPIKPRFRVLEPVADGAQGRIDHALPGWSLTLVEVESSGPGDFDGVIEARSTGPEVTAAELDRLNRRLFAVLGLIAGREVGIGPVCGVDRSGHVVWAEWAPPRHKPGKSAAWWCPPHLVPAALPALATGYGAACADPAREKILERAINMLLAADGDEVLDVRIPVATSGLELVSWAVLVGDQRMAQRDFDDLSAGEACTRLCQWGGIPSSLPDSLPNLIARRERLGQSEWEGPEIVFNVRNRLVHPPARVKDPEWPSGEELADAWQLVTWYLQMAILRLLDYQGLHWSRLRLGRSEMEAEPVPWA